VSMRILVAASSWAGRVTRESSAHHSGRARRADARGISQNSAFAYVQVPFDGQTICMRLLNENPADENSFAVDRGAVRNFQWKLTGALGVDGATVGASLRLANSYLWYRRARAIELTLTPNGPLLDGSTGAAIVREVMLEAPASDDGLVDLPLGKYTVQATRIDKDGRRVPIRMNTASYGASAPTLSLRWRSSNRCGLGSNSGVETLPLWLEPPT
jgi:hypothetical protein